MKKPLGRNNDLTFHMNPELCSFYSFIDVCIYWMQIDDQRSEMGSPKWRKKHISEHRKGVCPGVSVSVPASPARKARCKWTKYDRMGKTARGKAVYIQWLNPTPKDCRRMFSSEPLKGTRRTASNRTEPLVRFSPLRT